MSAAGCQRTAAQDRPASGVSGGFSRPRTTRRPAATLVLLAAIALAALASVSAPPSAPAAATVAQDGTGRGAARPGVEGARPTYRPPVDAPVVDPFRAPATRYGAGNRGIEYATVPGTPVTVAAEGTVTFAGLVAGSQHVTVQHADGIRTSYSFVAAVRVAVGDELPPGAVVAIAGATLHIGARRGATYIDPASLWGTPRVEVHLVPLDGGVPEPRPGVAPADERAALRSMVAGARAAPLGRRLAVSVRRASVALERVTGPEAPSERPAGPAQQDDGGAVAP